MKRSEHELIPSAKIETGPIDVGHLVIEDRGDICRVRDRVALAVEDALDLAQGQGVVDYAGMSFGRSA